MIDPHQFRLYVVRATLESLEPFVPYSRAAENLLVGTALVESRLRYLKQKGSGPALGVYQVEPATHEDLWESYLAPRIDLLGRVRSFASQRFPHPHELVWNLAYATVIARLVYWRSPHKLPEQDDAQGLAETHKAVFNTPLGATVVSESVKFFRKVVAGGDLAE